ncbi:MAG TPA: hypothetical protein VGF65_07935 [Mycobacterium sp.]|jgi:preprotein translocase subunit SecG
MNRGLGFDTKITLLAAGLLFLLALVLGVGNTARSWPPGITAMVVVFFFAGAILSYISHGARRDTTNQFENPDRGTEVAMALLIAGEIGGFDVILAGFIVGQLF